MECPFRSKNECSLSRMLTTSCVENLNIAEDRKPVCAIYKNALELNEKKEVLDLVMKDLKTNRRIIANLTKLLFVLHDDMYMIEKDNKLYACITVNDEICMWEINGDEEREEYSAIPLRKRHRHSEHIQTY